MKKMLIGTTVLLAIVAALGRFGPALAKRAMMKCEAMFDRMPANAPPKQMCAASGTGAEHTNLAAGEEDGKSLASIPAGPEPASDVSPSIAASS